MSLCCSSNFRLMAYSPHLLSILIGCLYEGTWSSAPSTGEDVNSSTSTLSLQALNTLVNLAPYLDLSGQKLLCDKLFLRIDGEINVPDAGTFGQATDGSWGFGGLWLAKRLDLREDVVSDIEDRLLLNLAGAVMAQVWAIFPALYNVMLDPKTPRVVLMNAVELLQEFMNQARVGVVGDVPEEATGEIPSARALLVNMPETLLQRLIDLLYVPRLGPDSLEYSDPTNSIVTRVTTLKLMIGYDGIVDSEIRDKILDLLLLLCELDSQFPIRLGVDKNNRPRLRLYDALVPILTSQGGRVESPALAGQLLQHMADKASEEKQIGIGMQLIKDRLIQLSTKNRRIATLVFQHLYVEDPNESVNSEEEEEEEERI